MQVWCDWQVTLCDPHLSALEARFSRRCAIQIDVYLYLYLIWLTNWTGDSALCWLHLLTAVYPTADRYVLLFAFTNFQPHVFEVFLTSLLLLQYMQVGFFYSIFTHKPTCDERKFISLKPSHKYDKSTIRLWETNATTKLQRSYAMRMKIIRNSYASITHTA